MSETPEHVLAADAALAAWERWDELAKTAQSLLLGHGTAHQCNAAFDAADKQRSDAVRLTAEARGK